MDKLIVFIELALFSKRFKLGSTTCGNSAKSGALLQGSFLLFFTTTAVSSCRKDEAEPVKLHIRVLMNIDMQTRNATNFQTPTKRVSYYRAKKSFFVESLLYFMSFIF